MELTKCYIENFGTLSDFEYQFHSGLNVIQEKNGFGKSTLAVFIKAMLYGYPKSASRSIAKNERKKYLPWQGGKYGGYLEFIYEGIHYRVTRFFGKTPAGDRFELFDLTNRERSKRFGEQLGDELFQLDADSFMHSIYMPQITDGTSPMTSSIQAKLSNLVDNTDDVNNYATAMKYLKEKRTTYLAYRGNGGKIKRLGQELNDLEENLSHRQEKQEALRRTESELEQMNEQRAQRKALLAQVRENVRAASGQKVVQIQQAQLAELEQTKRQTKQEWNELNGKYPNGYPTKEEIAVQRNYVMEWQQVKKSQEALHLSDEDERLREQGAQLFANPEQTQQDIRRCRQDSQELEAIQDKLSAFLSEEELRQQETLQGVFANGVPSKEECNQYARIVGEWVKNQVQWENCGLSDDKQQRLEELEQRFAAGVPEREELALCERQQQELGYWRQRREEVGLTGQEQEEWERLAAVFGRNLPQEEEIIEKQEICRTIGKREQEREIEKATLRQRRKTIQVLAGVGGGCLLFGIVGVMLAPWMGWVLLAAGAFAMGTAYWMHTKMAGAQGGGQEIDALRREVNTFLGQFGLQMESPEESLAWLLRERQNYVRLCDRRAQLEQESQKVDAQIENLTQSILTVFRRFYGGQSYQDDFIVSLRRQATEYALLKQQEEEQQEQRQTLQAEAAALEGKLERIFGEYYPESKMAVHDFDGRDEREEREADCGVEPQVLLQRLLVDVRSMRQLQEKWNQWQQEREKGEVQIAALRSEIEEILKRYQVFSDEMSYESSLNGLQETWNTYQNALCRVEDDRRQRETLAEQRREIEGKMADFAEKYSLPTGEWSQEILEQAAADGTRSETLKQIQAQTEEKWNRLKAEMGESLPEGQTVTADSLNLEEWQEEERRLQSEWDEQEERLHALRQYHNNLQQEIEKLNDWSDIRDRLLAEKNEAEKRCQMLDETMGYLEQAKDNLTHNYVGRVETGLEEYANKLLELEGHGVLLDKDWNVLMDEKGAVREVDYFSVGTIDCIMVCMRLALVDALFEQEKPFLILDDPFVNLDDEHMVRALAMLERMAKTHQIVYLSCSGSRCGESGSL